MSVGCCSLCEYTGWLPVSWRRPWKKREVLSRSFSLHFPGIKLAFVRRIITYPKKRNACRMKDKRHRRISHFFRPVFGRLRKTRSLHLCRLPPVRVTHAFSVWWRQSIIIEFRYRRCGYKSRPRGRLLSVAPTGKIAFCFDVIIQPKCGGAAASVRSLFKLFPGLNCELLFHHV